MIHGLRSLGVSALLLCVAACDSAAPKVDVLLSDGGAPSDGGNNNGGGPDAAPPSNTVGNGAEDGSVAPLDGGQNASSSARIRFRLQGVQ